MQAATQTKNAVSHLRHERWIMMLFVSSFSSANARFTAPLTLSLCASGYNAVPAREKYRTWRIVISPMIPQDFPPCYYSSMRNLAVLVIHLIATLARLLGPGGVRSLVAESLLLKHQLLIVNRSRQRSPNLSARDRKSTGCSSPRIAVGSPDQERQQAGLRRGGRHIVEGGGG
jgi:hypothetical protein